MSFYTSLSGLQAAQTDMSTISHNIANVATNGFKKSRSEFTDIMASNFTSDPRRLTGSGAALAQNKQMFGAGSLVTTGSSLDLAIAGDGFFPVKTAAAGGSTIAYTRNGSFGVDPNRYITDTQGSRLQAYAVETDGTVPNNGTLIDVQVPMTSGTARATGTVTLKAALNSGATGTDAEFKRTDPSTYTSATSTTVYDAMGNAQTLTNYFVRKPAEAAADGTELKSSDWTVYSYIGDTAANEGAGTPVSFDAEGNLISGNGEKLVFDGAGDPRTITLDLTGTTAAKQPFAIASRSQDGQALGEFAGITVDSAGVITASYSNGDAVKLGKVALANFVNPTGLRQNGGQYWSATGLSGTATMGGANENGFGKLMSGTIEGSNVDITEELVELIAAQRNFQANAKALDTSSQISQTIFNIRA
ncbi:flagellar hook protein FlgE [Sphingomonas sp. IC4-52]|uniref:flagellar hook protein FlgE n=1 Tax=Sphingomonas sp. IC4-52 TaxID=2887202 RepID=UPI001D0FEBD9|nr:flagellar hook protein FlgE [Sphingomonas sp. IC4-52]MCC2979983.1 flagellar hook protein FlgE [Sphingomonas sp. IC4-52]